MASCTCIRADSGVITDPSCRAHEGEPTVGDHRGDPPPFKQMIKQAVKPPAELTGVQRVSWYVGLFVAFLIVLVIVGAVVGLVLGLINWIFL